MLDKNDKKEIRIIVTKVVGTALEQVVLPEFEKIGKKLAEHDEQFVDVHNSLNRIETLAKSEIKYVDDLSKRVVKLETKSA